MKLLDLFRTANGGLKRSKTRTFLTVTAIFIGAMTLTLTNGIGTGIKGYLNQQVSELGAKNVMQIVPNGSDGQSSNSDSPAKYDPTRSVSSLGQLEMTTKDENIVKAVPNISAVEPGYSYSPDYIAGKNGKYELNNVGNALGDDNSALAAGAHVNNASDQNQIVLPDSYVSSMGYGDAQSLVGHQVTIAISDAAGQQSTLQVTVVGVAENILFGSQAATVNTKLSNELYGIQSTGLPPATADEFPMLLASYPDNLSQAQITTLENTLKAKGYSAQTLQSAEKTIFDVVNVVIIVLDTFGAITLLAASFGIVNTLYMAVQERTKEIGLMKALGMGRGQIFALFSIEAVMIGFWGSVLGAAFATGVGTLVDHIAKNGFLKDISGLTLLTFPAMTLVEVVLGIMLLAFLAGTLPALRASRKNPIEALRYE